MKSKLKQDQGMKDFKEIDQIKDFLYRNKLKIIKLNHQVDQDI